MTLQDTLYISRGPQKKFPSEGTGGNAENVTKDQVDGSFPINWQDENNPEPPPYPDRIVADNMSLLDPSIIRGW